MADDIDVGGYEIKSCVIRSYDETRQNDIASIVAMFRISEGIGQQAMTGSVIIGDTMGFIDDFPLLGEESVEIKIRDFYDDEHVYKFRIYAVESLDTDFKGQVQGYILKLHSPDFLKSETTDVMKSYRGPISTHVQDVFDEYFTETEKELDIENPTNSKTFVIPGMSPYATMNFFVRKAYNNENSSSNYRFFETKEKYVFKTIEKLIEEGKETANDEQKTFTYQDMNVEFADRNKHMQNMIEFKLAKRFDTVGEIRAGAQISETISLDLATKTYDTTIYKHKDEIESYQHVDDKIADYHTDKFIEENFSEENVIKTFVVFNDSSEQDETFYQDITARRISNNYYLNSIRMMAKLYGRNKLNPGDMISFTLPEVKYNKSDAGEHKSLSGYWFIETITHTLQDKQWRMDVTLLKDALRGE